MTPITLLKYLVGNREAIDELADWKQTPWLGLVLVLSAGLAREYDGEDLLHEPWHLFLPVGASLVTSVVLFLLVFGIAFCRGTRGPFWRRYRSFLGLYWLTAPLAWLYAIPVERFLSPGMATQVNLSLLAAVSLWRVLLMTRVVSVLLDTSVRSAFCMVMLFADSVALLLLRLVPLPVVSLMGGIRLTESEQVIHATSMLVGFFGCVSLPVWLFGVLAILNRRHPKWEWLVEIEPAPSGSRSIWILAAMSLLVWIPFLPATQREQQLRHRVDRAMKGGQIQAGLDILSVHRQDEFPPHWEPPPRLGYGEKLPELIAVMEAIADASPAAWVRSVYIEKFKTKLQTPHYELGYWGNPENDQLERHLVVLRRLPEGPQLLSGQRSSLEEMLSDERLSEAVREHVNALLEAENEGGGQALR